MRSLLALLGAIGALAVLSSPARADEPRELEYDLRVDLPIGITALAITAVPLFLHGPSVCRACGENGFDEGARRGLMWSNTHAAYNASNAFALALPLVGLGALGIEAGLGGSGKSFAQDGLMVGQAVLAAMAINQVFKYTVARERPWVNHQNPSVLAEDPRRSEDNVSFYSAHTGFAFALVSATATIAQLRGYRSAPYIWAIGLPLAAATGYFRIAADRHYLSDVIVGALVSTAVGIALPRLLHGRKSESWN
jgi:membrane-associated phospholipid phosphatase